MSLPPLVTHGAVRHLFIPARSDAGVIFVDNGANGTDAFPPCSELALRLGCDTARIVLSRDDPSVPTYGATIIETFVPNEGTGLNYGRVISAANDGGTWRFHTSGEPFGFEDHARYSARRIRDRFPPELLATYLDELDIPVLDGDAFDPSRAVLVTRYGLDHPQQHERIPGC